ncbi:unnamed protein product [Linum trigynum]|uniref:Uncharacterized protein n=1 Tax=Linum trigynum TaxID=586398 RepID=A0AAV2DHC6_9ROSI
MSKVFSLNSDNEFISPFMDALVAVLSYKGDVNDFRTIQGTDYYSNDDWGTRVEVGPGEEYEGIKLFGTTIVGDKFKQLVDELKSVEDRERIHFFVNRLGLCIVGRIGHPTISAMRINDYFGWSKYGVKLPQDVTKFTVWSRADMHSGETLIDARGMSRAAEEALQRSLEEKSVELAACKKELKEKNVELVVRKKEMEEKEMELVACKKEMEENNVELVACKKGLEEKNVELAACKKELEWSKRIESLQSELMEKKDKEVETMKNQLLAFKDILRSLIDH